MNLFVALIVIAVVGSIVRIILGVAISASSTPEDTKRTLVILNSILRLFIGLSALFFYFWLASSSSGQAFQKELWDSGLLVFAVVLLLPFFIMRTVLGI